MSDMDAAEAGVHNKLLGDGMRAWVERAKEKWLAAGGYGAPLTPEERAEIRAAGFEPAPLDPLRRAP